MSFRHLAKTEAFSPGAALWIVSEPASSRAAELLDWRLNFLMGRAVLESPRRLSAEIMAIAERVEYEPPTFAARAGAPLLIESGRFAPCRAVASIPWAGKAEDWAKAARQVWNDLGQPAARVFLPAAARASAFEGEWTRAHRDAHRAQKAGDAPLAAEMLAPLEIVNDSDF